MKRLKHTHKHKHNNTFSVEEKEFPNFKITGS